MKGGGVIVTLHNAGNSQDFSTNFRICEQLFIFIMIPIPSSILKATGRMNRRDLVSPLSMNKPTQPDKQTLSSSDAPKCEIHCPVHLDNLRQVQPELLPMTKAQRMAELFGVLADPNRLRLLSALASQELCVCDLAAAAKMSESAVSHQLRILRTMRLVSYRK